MNQRIVLAIVTLSAGAAALSAQGFERRATITGRGASGDREKCTLEVRVDGVAEVEIRGDNAILKTLAGAPAQWRRFECSAPMPPHPPDFRFNGVDGRGRQQLIRDPREGAAIVRIEDPQSGSEGYTFDITWARDGNPGYSDDRSRPAPPPPAFPGAGILRRFTTEQAVQVCQDAIRQQAADRFRTPDVKFRRINLDDTPGRNDWVVGIIDVHFGGNREEPYRFSCSVNFDTGRVRSAEIVRLEEDRDGPGPRGGPSASDRAIDSCRRAVEDRIRRDGYGRVNIRSINVDDRPGRNDWVVGTADADARDRRGGSFTFSCSVDLRDGDVRSVDVNQR